MQHRYICDVVDSALATIYSRANEQKCMLQRALVMMDCIADIEGDADWKVLTPGGFRFLTGIRLDLTLFSYVFLPFDIYSPLSLEFHVGSSNSF